MRKLILILIIGSIGWSCNKYEVLVTQINFQGHLREDGNNRPLSNFKVILRTSDYQYLPDFQCYIENHETVQFDSTFTNGNGDFIFELPFKDSPSKYYELTTVRPGFLDYTVSNFFRNYNQIDTLTIGNSTRFELELEFNNFSEIEFSILGYQTREEMEDDRPFYSNPLEFSRLGNATFINTFLSKTIPYDSYAYLVLRGVDISGDFSRTVVEKEFIMIDGGIINHKEAIDD